VTRGQELEVPTAAVGTWSDMVVAVSSACTFGQAECSAIIETLRATSGLIAGKGGPAERLALKRTTLQNKVHPSASQKNIIRSSELPQLRKAAYLWACAACMRQTLASSLAAKEKPTSKVQIAK